MLVFYQILREINFNKFWSLKIAPFSIFVGLKIKTKIDFTLNLYDSKTLKISTLYTLSYLKHTKMTFLNKSFFFRQGVTPLAPRVQASIGKCLRDKPTYEAFAHSMTTTSTRMRRRLRSQMLFPVRMRRTRRLCAQCGNNGNSQTYNFSEISFTSFFTFFTRFHGIFYKWEFYVFSTLCIWSWSIRSRSSTRCRTWRSFQSGGFWAAEAAQWESLVYKGGKKFMIEFMQACKSKEALRSVNFWNLIKFADPKFLYWWIFDLQKSPIFHFGQFQRVYLLNSYLHFLHVLNIYRQM